MLFNHLLNHQDPFTNYRGSPCHGSHSNKSSSASVLVLWLSFYSDCEHLLLVSPQLAVLFLHPVSYLQLFNKVYLCFCPLFQALFLYGSLLLRFIRAYPRNMVRLYSWEHSTSRQDSIGVMHNHTFRNTLILCFRCSVDPGPFLMYGHGLYWFNLLSACVLIPAIDPIHISRPVSHWC